jgi:enoyl-CoA hydratase/carnithine racemase
MNLDDACAALASLSPTRREGAVHLLVDGPLARIELDNPSARNAMTLGMMVDLGKAVIRLLETPSSVIWLTSRHPGIFCSGGHLAEVRASFGDPDYGRVMARSMTAILDALWQAPSVVVGSVDGPALGGGAELLTACDLVVAGPRARVGFVQASLGVAAGWGGARRLVARAGRSAALRWLAAADVVDADEACRRGLVDRVASDPHAEAQAWFGPMLGHPPEAVGAVKRQVVGVEDPVAVFASVWGGSAHRAAVERRGR